MEKTLIIHPKDESTGFLKSIYKNVNSPTILNGQLTKEEVHTLIYHYDQVMMMGHGCPSGLFGVNWGYHLIIDDSNVHALKQKDNNVFIWCHANRFVEQHNLKGFYSGMFISEVNEAIYYNIESNQEMINESNHIFSKTLGEIITESVDEAFYYIVDRYGKLSKSNPVAKYNVERLRLTL